jgi:hypothetical protein
MLDPLPQLESGKPLDADLINSNFEALRLFNNDIVTRYQALLDLSDNPPEYNAIIEDLNIFGNVDDITYDDNKLKASKLNENFEKFKVALLLTGINNKRINDATGRGVDGSGAATGSEDGLIDGKLINGLGANYYKEYVILCTPSLTGYDIILKDGHYYAPLSWTCSKCLPEQVGYQIFRLKNWQWGEFEYIYTKEIDEYSQIEFYLDDLGASVTEDDIYYYKIRTVTPKGISGYSNTVGVEIPEEVLPGRPPGYPNMPYPPTDGTKSHSIDGIPWPPSNIGIQSFMEWYASDWYNFSINLFWQDNSDNESDFVISVYENDNLLGQLYTTNTYYNSLSMGSVSEHTTHNFLITISARNSEGVSIPRSLAITVINLEVTYEEF